MDLVQGLYTAIFLEKFDGGIYKATFSSQEGSSTYRVFRYEVESYVKHLRASGVRVGTDATDSVVYPSSRLSARV